MNPDPDSDPDPGIFVSDLQDVNKKFSFFCLLLVEGTFTSVSKTKSHKEGTKVGNNVLPTNFA
jgi:hypothetical protein